MNYIRIREIVVVYSLIFILVLILSILPGFLVSRDIEYVRVLPEEFSNGTNDLKHTLREKDQPIIDNYRAVIEKERLSTITDEDLGLTITRLEGQGYRVWWNGEELGYAGDPDEGNANIWNSSHRFTIDKELVEEINTLDLTIHTKYDMGAFDESILITNVKNSVKINSRHELFSTYMTLISLGMTILAMIITGVLVVLKTRHKFSLMSMTLALVFVSVSSMDYLKTEQLFLSYLLFKKIIISSMFVAIGFAGFAISSSLKKRLPAIMGVITLVVFLTWTFTINDMLVFKRFYNIAMILIPLNFVGWLIIILPKLKSSDEARIYFGGMLILTSVGVWETVSLSFMPSALATSQLPIVMVGATMLLLFISLETIARNRQLNDEITHRDRLFHKTITDELSGLYNKAYCSNLISRMRPPFAVAMLDIDKFKYINDTHGHVLGDRAIRHVAEIVKDILREDDIIGRYGGDEFMLAIRCTPERALQICNRLREAVMSNPLYDSGKKVILTVSIGVYHVIKKQSVELMVKNADKALYEAKEDGRNRVAVFSS